MVGFLISFAEALEQTSGSFVPLGELSSGDLFYLDLNQITHLLISGASGTGKSTILHTILLSILFHSPSENNKFYLCDMKGVEFSEYKGIPQLYPLIFDSAKKIVTAIELVNLECSRRLRLFSEVYKKDLKSYNDYAWEQFISDTGLPPIFLCIDDLSFLMSQLDTDLAASAAHNIQQILINGRTVGVHLFAVASAPTQKALKPISSLFPSKILFFTQNQSKSKTLIGSKIASSLCPLGEAVFSSGAKLPVRFDTFLPTSSDFCMILSPLRASYQDQDDLLDEECLSVSDAPEAVDPAPSAEPVPPGNTEVHKKAPKKSSAPVDHQKRVAAMAKDFCDWLFKVILVIVGLFFAFIVLGIIINYLG